MMSIAIFSCFCQSSSVNLLFHFLSLYPSVFFPLFTLFFVSSVFLHLSCLLSTFFTMLFLCLQFLPFILHFLFVCLHFILFSLLLPLLYLLSVFLFSVFRFHCYLPSVFSLLSEVVTLFFFAPSPLPVFSSDLSSVIL